MDVDLLLADLKHKFAKLQENDALKRENTELRRGNAELKRENDALKRKNEQLQREIAKHQPKPNEVFYQKYLETKYNVGHFKSTHGISDLEGDDFIVEVKAWKQYKHVLGQIHAYNHNKSKRMIVYLFGDPVKQKDSVVELFIQHNIELWSINYLNGAFYEECLDGGHITRFIKENIKKIDLSGRHINSKEDLAKYVINRTQIKQRAEECGLQNVKFKIILDKIEDYTGIKEKTTGNRYNSIKYYGFLGLQLKNDEYEMFVNEHVAYSEGDYVQRSDLLTKFFNNKPVDNVLKSKTTDIFNNIFSRQFGETFIKTTLVNRVPLKGWRNIRLVENAYTQ